MAVIGTVRRLKEAYWFRAGYLDQTGVGEAPYEEIRQFMRRKWVLYVYVFIEK